MGWFHVGSGQLTVCASTQGSHTEHVSKSKHPNGAMEELSGNVQKASTHVSSVGIDIAVVERDCASVDVDATSILPNNGGTSVKASTPTGRWRKLQGRIRRQGLTFAVLELIWHDWKVTVAPPLMRTPPPSCQTTEARQYKRAPHRGDGGSFGEGSEDKHSRQQCWSRSGRTGTWRWRLSR